MNPLARFREIIDAYSKHGWRLRRVLMRPQTRAEVEQLLKETKLDEQMKAFDQWDDWVKRRRGVSR